MGKSIICLGRGGLGKAFEEHGVSCYDRRDVDINDICELNNLFCSVKPKYVINCAGMVGTGKCEHEPEMAYMVNVGGVSNIAYMCRKYSASLIHFSTFYVGDYNVYTKSKMMAESIINELIIDKLIVRLPWIFGRNTNNFILSGARGKDVSIYDDEYGYLAYDDDIVNYVIDGIGNQTGTVMLANDGEVLRKDILDFIGCKYSVMKRAVDMPSVAPKPNVLLRHWKEPMREFIDGFRSV